jgi:hypothetical protein
MMIEQFYPTELVLSEGIISESTNFGEYEIEEDEEWILPKYYTTSSDDAKIAFSSLHQVVICYV